jgi:hypothetical protein
MTAVNYGHADYQLTGYDFERIRKQIAAKARLGKKGVERFSSSADFREKMIEDYLPQWSQAPDAALPPELRELLHRWVGNTPRGWGQIEAVIDGLRRHGSHDPQAAIPPGETDPLRYFLIESRRGPDYLFATAAVVFLRHLGYPSRMVGGFYVRPEEYRLLTQATPVHAGDVHYWAQVRSPNQLWINLEPTPGYEPARPDYTVTERMTQRLDAAGEMIQRYRWVLLSTLLVTAGIVVFRRRLMERLATAGWLLGSGRPVRRLVPATWRLIDRRARTAGAPRGQGMTLRTWSAAVAASAPSLGGPLAELARIADGMTHAPPRSRTWQDQPDAEVRAACRAVVGRCTVAGLRQALRRRQ